MSHLKKTVTSAMLIALCAVLPLMFHAIGPFAGRAFLPMHIPVLLAGLICGPVFGLIVGLTGPLLSSLTTGMPPMGAAPVMMVELGTYGLVAGIMIKLVHTRQSVADLYISLLAAMIVGRIVAGIAQALFFYGGTYIMAAWVASYFTLSVPGIVIQLMLIPVLVVALERERVIPPRYSVSAGT